MKKVLQTTEDNVR